VFNTFLLVPQIRESIINAPPHHTHTTGILALRPTYRASAANVDGGRRKGVGHFRYMTVSVHTLSVHVFFGTASFGTLNVNIGTVTFGTYKISVQSTSVDKCQFQY